MKERQLSVHEAIIWGTGVLKEIGIQTSRLDAELLLSHVLKCERAHLIVINKEKLTHDDLVIYRRLIEDRRRGIPVAYITGFKEFMGIDFIVNQSVLIPRPETEILVEALIQRLKGVKSPKILDIGTGSGCIGISLAYFITDSSVYATDISSDALAVAKTNARRLGVEDRVFFYQGDVYDALPDEYKGYFDVIVSNPPYIPSVDIKNLSNEVKSEPALALDGGKDGLRFYRKIIAGAFEYLKKGGLLAFEVGYDQAQKVKSMMMSYSVDIIKDLAGIERVVIGRRIS
ncbi:release factor glutamine methyltransferase [Caldanaerobius fijiensis DSM 17918]|uniref:Release factor glutamine methyltransferase n=1 Tax=Caldanaerobius fijiensis DSM 17918 TaxID=1121256 RepID=A0A1M4W5Y5_9THEO|nr:peptide chain release factor N(5)-glutamine methyltransferase [Caldanaerobius fijiensis]SHE76560.1 release factor glutamine methyltransferase [Caldanaerobius fijiensis DSM 17918]